MARSRGGRPRGFTLIEVMVAIGILGILMSAIMVAFQQTMSAVEDVQQNAELMQSIRAATEQFHRELSQAIINNNRPDGEQVYLQIRQLSVEQSVLRFGCTTERGLVEIGYQVRPDEGGWQKYELWRLYKTEGMWNYNEPNWPALDFEPPNCEPFAFGIVSFKVYFWSSQTGKWVAGNWESIQRNAMPKRIRIRLQGMTKRAAKEARNIKELKDVPGIETTFIEVNLPQAR
jgi:type II secretion system protein J